MRDLLFEKIDLAASRLRPYQGFIFLCGGPTDAKSVNPISIRDALYQELVKNDSIHPRIKLAEHYKDWSHESVYSDLVSFEQHLAELSSVIVLVLESAGSIAELGLFSIIKEFQKKLLVFVASKHYENNGSFIKLGPIDFLEKNHNNKVHCQPWTKNQSRVDFDPEVAKEIQGELAETVIERAEKIEPERGFFKEGWLDSALLLCDFLNIHSALTFNEIRNIFDKFGIEKKESEIRQMLFVLQKVGLLSMRARGEQRFYVGTEQRQFISFSSRDRSFDLDRYRMDILNDYKSDDKKRYRLIQEVRGVAYADR